MQDMEQILNREVDKIQQQREQWLVHVFTPRLDPPYRHVFLCTNYRDSCRLTLPSGLKAEFCEHSKTSAGGRVGAGATAPHVCPSELLPHPLRGHRDPGTNCTQAMSSVKCLCWPICDDKNKLCKQIWQRNPQSKHLREIADYYQIFCEHLVREISSNKIYANKIILAVLFWIQSSLNWRWSPRIGLYLQGFADESEMGYSYSHTWQSRGW